MKVWRSGPAAFPSATSALPAARASGFCSFVGLKGLHGFLVFPARLQEEARGTEFWVRLAAGQGHLLADGRHGIPAIVYVGDAVPLQTAEILVPKPALVAQLNGVGPALLQLAEKRVEVGHEIPSV